MLYIKLHQEEGDRYLAIEEPIWLKLQRNGMVVRCGAGDKPGGILLPKRGEICQLVNRPTLGGDYPLVTEITMAEYDAWVALENQPPDPDPEDTEPVIPEDIDPDSVLTRAELTEKVRRLEEELENTKALMEKFYSQEEKGD
jgi:hypothetical protein